MLVASACSGGHVVPSAGMLEVPIATRLEQAELAWMLRDHAIAEGLSFEDVTPEWHRLEPGERTLYVGLWRHQPRKAADVIVDDSGDHCRPRIYLSAEFDDSDAQSARARLIDAVKARWPAAVFTPPRADQSYALRTGATTSCAI